MSVDQELQENYLAWTKQSLSELDSLVRRLAAPDRDLAAVVEQIYGIAHNIKGMGASFGYPLMTEAGTSFCRYLRALEGAEPHYDVIEAHARSLRVIIENDIKGDGGELGAKLVEKLGTLVEKSVKAA